MKKTIIGIILFVMQISLALYYNQSIDLEIVAGITVVIFSLIMYKSINKKYDAAKA